jgi:hypothetical protein
MTTRSTKGSERPESRQERPAAHEDPGESSVTNLPDGADDVTARHGAALYELAPDAQDLKRLARSGGVMLLTMPDDRLAPRIRAGDVVVCDRGTRLSLIPHGGAREFALMGGHAFDPSPQNNGGAP